MSQNCGRLFPESLITGLLDGALDQEESRMITTHLQDCATCRKLFDELSMVRIWIQQIRLHEPGETPANDTAGEHLILSESIRLVHCGRKSSR
ncbi:MAG: zf-HC2 domain-containing protein [Acidobacteriota bacterium]